MYTNNQPLLEALEKRKILIAAHRGTCGANIIKNTCLAYQNALLHGSDMIEVDAAMTTDGVFYAFHDGGELRELGVTKNIREMTSEEVEGLSTINPDGDYLKQRVERLDYVLEKFRDRCLINIDRSWFYWKEVIAYLKSKKMDHQILLKSPVEEKLLQELQDNGEGLMYMPIVKSLEEWKMVQKFDVNVAAAELIFEDLEGPFTDPAFLKRLNDRGILPWVNVITLNDVIILSGGLDDNSAIADGFDENWGRLIDMGYKILQTDWPTILRSYVNQKFEMNGDL